MVMQSVKDCFLDVTHRLFYRPEIEIFLPQYFARSILDIFRCFIPYAYKLDLARYCLLYVHGAGMLI